MNRKWILAAGALSLLVGIAAIAAPGLVGLFLTQLLGAFLFIGGAMALGTAVFGKNQHHRWVSALSALIRVAAGLALFLFTVPGLLAITLVLAAAFAAEGIVCIGGALMMRPAAGWAWILLNGIVALLLAGMIYARWPADSMWVVGVLFGIQSLFSGSAFLALGFGTPGKA